MLRNVHGEEVVHVRQAVAGARKWRTSKAVVVLLDEHVVLDYGRRDLLKW